jgi:hypothetical protein
MRSRRLVVTGLVALVATSCSTQPIHPEPRLTAGGVIEAGSLTAVPVKPDARVGAVFLGSKSEHTCTGSVLDSLAGDLIITAAHCLDSSADSYFAPGYAGSGTPAEFWHVDAVYLDPRWVNRHDPAADFAIARVGHGESAPAIGTLEEHAGGGFVLGSAPGPDETVQVMGYPSGDGGVPVRCSGATARAEQGFPSVRCPGLVDGTSGSPWIAGSEVRGVVGGFQGGGCAFNDLSYSAPFDIQIRVLYQRALQGGTADQATGAPDDGCG